MLYCVCRAEQARTNGVLSGYNAPLTGGRYMRADIKQCWQMGICQVITYVKSITICYPNSPQVNKVGTSLGILIRSKIILSNLKNHSKISF